MHFSAFKVRVSELTTYFFLKKKKKGGFFFVVVVVVGVFPSFFQTVNCVQISKVHGVSVEVRAAT